MTSLIVIPYFIQTLMLIHLYLYPIMWVQIYQIKRILMPNSDDTLYSATVKHLLIIFLIKMQNFIHYSSLIKHQLIDLMQVKVNQYPIPLCLQRVGCKGQFQDILAFLIDYFIIYIILKEDRSYWILPENDWMTNQIIIAILHYRRRTIVMQDYPLPVFLITTQSSHINSIAIVSQWSTVVDRTRSWRRPLIIVFLFWFTTGHLGQHPRLTRREPHYNY